MTETATPKRPPAEEEPGQHEHPYPAPRPKDAPRTMRDLRLSRATRRKTHKQEDNPLREGLRLERVPDPSTMVLFGATGDLAHRKVVPALYQLWRTNLLPHEFVLLAIGRRDYTDETLRAQILEEIHIFTLAIDHQRGKDHQAGVFGKLQHMVDHL